MLILNVRYAPAVTSPAHMHKNRNISKYKVSALLALLLFTIREATSRNMYAESRNLARMSIRTDASATSTNVTSMLLCS